MKKAVYILVLTLCLFGGASHSYALTCVAASGAAGNWTSAGAWTACGGGAPTSADDALITAVTTSITINNGATAKSVDFTGFTGTATHSASATWNIYGGLIMSSGMTYSANALTSLTNFLGTASFNITMNGQNVAQPTFNGSGGTWTLQDNFTASSPTLFGNTVLAQGTLDLNGKTLDTGLFQTSGTGTKVLTFGAGTIKCRSAANTFSYQLAGSNLTVNANTGTVEISGGQLNANFGGKSHYNVTITGVNTSMTLTSPGTITNALSISSAASAGGVIVLAGDPTVSGATLTLAGNSAKNRLLIRSSASGTRRTITNTGTTHTWSNVDFMDIGLTSSYNASAITGGSGNAGNNNNITFTTASTWYFKATTNNGTANNYDWSERTNWYTATNGGGTQMASGASPLAQDTLNIDTNSFTTTSTLQTDMYILGKDISFSGNTDILTLTDNVKKMITGSLNLTGVTTNSWNDTTLFTARANATLTNAGVSWIDIVTLDPFGATFTLADAFTSSASLTHSSGTFDSAGYTVTASTISLTGGTQNPGASTWVMTGTASVGSAVTVFSRTGGTFNAGTSVLKATGATGKTVFNDTVASPVYYGVWIARGTNADDVGFRRGFTATYIQNTGTVAHTMRFLAGGTFTFTGTSPFQVSGSAGQLISVNSCTDSATIVASTGTHTLSATNGSAIIDQDYLNIQHSVATQANTWYAGTHSTDNQSVTTAGSGWIFTAKPTVGTFSFWKFSEW